MEQLAYVLGYDEITGPIYLSGDCNKTSLELGGSDLGDSVGRVHSRLKRKHVGEETSNVRRSHGSTGNGVHGVLASSPGRLDALARCEDVVALAEVGEVGPLVSQVTGTN